MNSGKRRTDVGRDPSHAPGQHRGGAQWKGAWVPWDDSIHTKSR